MLYTPRASFRGESEHPADAELRAALEERILNSERKALKRTPRYRRGPSREEMLAEEGVELEDAEMRARDAWDETARDLIHAEGARTRPSDAAEEARYTLHERIIDAERREVAEEIRLLERANSKASRKAQTQPKAARRGSTAQPMSAHELKLQEEGDALRRAALHARSVWGEYARVRYANDRARFMRDHAASLEEARATLDSQASAREEAAAIKARPKPEVGPYGGPVFRWRPDPTQLKAWRPPATIASAMGEESRASSLPASPRGLPRVESPRERARADVVGGGWRPVGGKIQRLRLPTGQRASEVQPLEFVYSAHSPRILSSPRTDAVRRAYDVHFAEKSPQALKTRKWGDFMELQERKALWGKGQSAVSAVARLRLATAMMTAP